MSSKEDRKADDLEKKVAWLIEEFDLSSTDVVVQDYHCSLLRFGVPVQGRMYITENDICFHSAIVSAIFLGFCVYFAVLSWFAWLWRRV